jgi:hypothetical protein
MSNDKPRLVEVTGPECAYLMEHRDELGVPTIYVGIAGFANMADADELRAWREARLQHTSCAEPK